MTNIKQTDLIEYLVNKFNENSMGIKFRLGTFGLNEDGTGLIVATPRFDRESNFDIYETYDEDTYQVDKNSFVAMGVMGLNGDYTPLPNVQLVSYDITLDFLVYIGSPISEIIRLAIEEVRDKLIGNLDVLKIQELDLINEEVTNDVYLRLTTTADSINFGDSIEIVKGKQYVKYDLSVGLTVSKDIDFGNQFKWEISDELINSWELSNEDYWNTLVGTGKRIAVDQSLSGVTSPQPNLIDASLYTLPFALKITYKNVSNDLVDAYYKLVKIEGENYVEVIPLIASMGMTQDMEAFQTLRSINPITVSKAKEVHNYVKSRGFGLTMTFLLNTKKDILRTLFKECFEEREFPKVYGVKMKFLEFDEASGDFLESQDIKFSRKMLVGEAEPSDIIYGTPTVFAIGFVKSAKG